MTGSAAARITAALTDVVERVFDTVAEVHAAALRSLRSPALDDGCALARVALDDSVQHLLLRPGQLAVGVGLVVAPPPDAAEALRFQWWQIDPDGDCV